VTTAVTVLYDTIRWEEKALLEAGKKKEHRSSDVRL